MDDKFRNQICRIQNDTENFLLHLCKWLVLKVSYYLLTRIKGQNNDLYIPEVVGVIYNWKLHKYVNLET